MKMNIIYFMTATLITAANTSSGRIRPLNLLRDLPSVADLIELCFSSTLDTEGRSYIDQMRRNGRDSIFLNWAPGVIETVSLPLSGFVWEHDSRVVGNVSLVPFFKAGQKNFLIANVATHPDYRRQGIARQLTLSALQRAREKHAQSIWLQVRDDNPGAIQLYQELGFVERARRTTWVASAENSSVMREDNNIQITSRSIRDWPLQSEWLSHAYPPELDWYFSLSWGIFKPGIINTLYCLFADITTRQWSIQRNGKLLGVFSCHRTNNQSNYLWAALPAQPEAEAVSMLLSHVHHNLPQSRNLTLEYPAGPTDEVFRSAGLVSQRTLVWMKAPGLQPVQS